MTEVKTESNILSSKKYPEIKDNTLNFLVPFYGKKQKQEIYSKVKLTFSEKLFKSLSIFDIKHPFNGKFIVFQSELK